jgi:glycosyltransferase involved in cell wall biosynthesis
MHIAEAGSAGHLSPARIGLIALVPDRWDGIWGTRHQVIGRLARRFDVVWVQPARGWREYWLGGGAAEMPMQAGVPVPSRLQVYDPGRWLPEVYSPPALGDWIRMRRVHRARQLLQRRGCTSIALYLWRPQFSWALRAFRPDFVCYHVDDEYRFSFERLPDDPEEVALIRAADQVIVTSPQLFERKGNFNTQTIQVPNGVDYAKFSAATNEPADLASIPRPRFGYVGVVQIQLDLELLYRVATRRPQWSFVLVGPRGFLGGKAQTLERLAILPNVHLLGNRPLRELPAYMQHMDVSMMCYAVNDYTNCIYPLKLHEYLAAGRPVVSTPIRSVLSFGGTVRLAVSDEEWDRALEEGLSPAANAPAAVAARRAVAAAHGWDLLVERIAARFQSGTAHEPEAQGAHRHA